MANPTKEIDGASTHPSSTLASLSDGHFMIPSCCVLLHLISNHVTGALGGSGLLVRFLETPHLLLLPDGDSHRTLRLPSAVCWLRRALTCRGRRGEEMWMCMCMIRTN